LTFIRHPPRRTRIGPLTLSHGELQATAAAQQPAGLRQLLAVASAAAFGMLELMVRLHGADLHSTDIVLTLAEQADVLDVRTQRPDQERAIAVVKQTLERSGPELGLRVDERPH
jgi:hypothetical protein